jgi:adenine-specific DNA-methyltransferase
LIIEGDNFDSLRLLKATHAGRVRVIYIDPPYNTGNKDWVYNDRFVGTNDRWRHSQWLEFLYQRLTLARDLLTSDGVILVSINDENRSRLELLMDEVFPGRRVGCFVWRSRTGGNDTKGAFFSDNHEHVLVYANSGFRFSGDEKNYSIYKHEEEGRVFYLSDLTSPKDIRERPNTYYPIQDPKTGTWYPCNPGRVWAYASRQRVSENQKLRGDTMEDMIEQSLVWFPPDQRVETYETLAELKAAIDTQDIPFSGATPLLTHDSPELSQWVGRKIGYGRPRLKKFKDGLKNENAPISSWLTPRSEADTIDDTLNMPIVGATDEGSRVLKEVMGDKAFPYPKPLSLIKTLLAQAAKSGDIVLDFFAGSGTTGQAVLELNAEDSGQRRFILCSSTETTTTEPNKNLCRDVTAERIRRVIAAENWDSEFAYLQLDKISPADTPFEVKTENALALLSLRETHAVWKTSPGSIQHVARAGDCDILLCLDVSKQTVKALVAWTKTHKVPRLAVYCERPSALQEALEAKGIDANCYSLMDALLSGQSGRSA